MNTPPICPECWFQEHKNCHGRSCWCVDCEEIHKPPVPDGWALRRLVGDGPHWLHDRARESADGRWVLEPVEENS